MVFRIDKKTLARNIEKLKKESPAKRQIADILCNYFNISGDNAEQLFNPTGKPRAQNALASKQQDPLLTQYPLSMAFKYGSDELCNELCLAISKQNDDFLDSIREEFYLLYQNATLSSRKKLANWLLSLSPAILPRLFETKFSKQATIFILADEVDIEIFNILLTAIKKIPAKERIELFNKQQLIGANYFHFIPILRERLRKNSGIDELLDLIDELPESLFPSMLYGGVIKYSDEGPIHDNLLRVLTEKIDPIKSLTKLLGILKKLDDSLLSNLFTAFENLHYKQFMQFFTKNPSQNQDDLNNLAIALITLFQKSPTLCRLLAGSNSDDSLLHAIVNKKLTKALIVYLEGPFPYQHKQRNKTALELAGTNEPIASYLKEKPILDAIIQEKNEGEGIQFSRDVAGNSPWSKGRSLIHMAVRANKTSFVLSLLTVGANPCPRDLDGNTPLDYALQAGYQNIAFALISQQGQLVQNPLKDGKLPLATLLTLVNPDFALIETLCGKLSALSEEDSSPSFLQALELAPNKIIQLFFLQEAFSKQKQPNQSLADYLQDCCKQSKDSIAYVIVQAARQFARDKLTLCSEFIMENLKVMGSMEADPIRIESSKWQLILFLFSLELEKRVELIKSLPLDSVQAFQLNTVLSTALHRPLIAFELDLDSLGKQEACLYEAETAKKALTHAYFKHSDLRLLDESILEHLANHLSPEELIIYSRESASPLIKVLALEKNTKQPEIAAELSQKLLISLKNNSDAALLKQTLNLVKTAEIKTRLRAIIETWSIEEKQLFKTGIYGLFKTAESKKTLQNQSLLEDLYLDQAISQDNIEDPSFAPSLEKFISEGSRECIFEVLESHRDNTELCPYITRGLLQRRDRQTLLMHIFDYSLMQQEGPTALLPHLAELLKSHHSNSWATIQTNLQRILVQCKAELAETDNNNTELSQLYQQCLSLLALLYGIHFEARPNVERLEKIINLLEEEDSPLSRDATEIWVQSYLTDFKRNPASLESQLFFKALVLILKKQSFSQQYIILASLDRESLNILLEQGLSGISSNDPVRELYCKEAVQMICQLAVTADPDLLRLIRTRLNQQNLEFLDTVEQQLMAKTILDSQSADLQELTYDGCWIQRLICSPAFVSMISLETFNKLIQRYRLISLSLKQDEYQGFKNWLRGDLQFSEDKQSKLLTYQQKFMADPIRKTRLLEKMKTLCRFRSEEAIRALLTQLEDNCMTEYGAPSESALNRLYSYYNQELAGVRFDLSFRASSWIYRKFFQNQGDLVKAQSTIYAWLNRLPHHNSVQSDLLVDKQDSRIFDHNNQEIGFINEENYVICFVDDEPQMLLSQPSSRVEMPLYNHSGRKIGCLGPNSQFILENSFQRDTSAKIISHLSTQQLQSSEAALEILVQDVLQANSINIILDDPHITAEKRAFLQNKLQSHLKSCPKPLAKTSIESLFNKLSTEEALDCLNQCKCLKNALHCFHLILQDEQKRTVLLVKGAARNFLSNFKTEQIFVEFLLQQNNNSWFANALTLFEEKQPDLFINSLYYLRNQLVKGLVTIMQIDGIFSKLLSQEVSATKILQWLCPNPKDSIQSTRNKQLDTFTSFFNKQHLLAAMRCFLERPSPCASSYFLLLLSLDAHLEALFKDIENPDDPDETWSQEELRIACQFAAKHFEYHQKRVVDRDFNIGKRLFLQLTIRTANFADTSLFYNNSATNNDQFNEQLAILNIRADEITSRHQSTANNRNLFNWRGMAEDSFSDFGNRPLQLITLFILNFNGKTKELNLLLHDLIYSTKLLFTKPDFLDELSCLMLTYPQRDFSKALFVFFQEEISREPSIATDVLLQNMAAYQQGPVLHTNSRNSFNNALQTLNHYGQQKRYTLVRKYCELLYKQELTSENRALIQTIDKEAKVELWLSKHLGRWYFGFLAPIIRFFRYRPVETTYIKLCNDETTYDKKDTPIATVNTAVTTSQVYQRRIRAAGQHQRLSNLRTSLTEQASNTGSYRLRLFKPQAIVELLKPDDEPPELIVGRRVQ